MMRSAGLLMGVSLMAQLARAGDEPGAPTLRGLFVAPETQGPVVRLAIEQITDEGATLVPWNHSFQPGQRLRFAYAANQDGYAYVLDTPPGAGCSLVWPPAGGVERVRRGSTSYFPPSGSFRLEPAEGQEMITIVVTPLPLAAKQIVQLRLAVERLERPTAGESAQEPAQAGEDPWIYFQGSEDVLEGAAVFHFPLLQEAPQPAAASDDPG